MNILWLREKFPWMGKYSGYELLIDELRGKVDGTSMVRNKFSNTSFETNIYETVNPGRFYTPSSYRVEKACIKEARAYQYDLYHVLYGDTNLSPQVQEIKDTGCKVTASVHQPPSWWDESHQKPEVLSLLDGVIALSSSCVPFLERYIEREKIAVIPHGIDISFWQPGEERNPEESPFCVVVGHWMRDYTCIFNVIRHLYKEQCPLRFKVVLAELPHNRNIIQGLQEIPTCEVFHGLSDEDLRSLYQGACALFLPLKDAMANNAVLEAMACGCPVVSTRIEGLYTYLGKEWPFYGERYDINGFCEMLRKLAYDTHTQKQFSSDVLYRSTQFSWSRIAEETRLFYERIVNLCSSKQ